MDHPFRSAAFGGFNRQDVLNYLEATAEKANKELDEQRKEIERLQQELDQQTRRADAAEGELKQTRQERDELRRQGDQLARSLEDSRREAKDKGQKLEQTSAELAQLRQRLEKLEPDAVAYATIKERTAGVELEAHRRAQNVEARAKIMAGDLQRQMEQWMAKVERQYATLRGEMDSSITRANEQLGRAGQCLERVSALMGEQETALKAVAQSYADAVQNKKAE